MKPSQKYVAIILMEMHMQSLVLDIPLSKVLEFDTEQCKKIIIAYLYRQDDH